MIAVIGNGRWALKVARELKEIVQQAKVSWGVRSTVYGQELQGKEPRIEVVSYAEAIEAHQVIVMAMLTPDAVAWAKGHAELLSGKIIVDVSIPYEDSLQGVLYDWDTSGTEELQKRLVQAKVVGAKSTAFTMPGTKAATDVTNVYITGDDRAAKDVIMRLFRNGRYVPVDAGALDANRAIDRMISLQDWQETVSDSSLRNEPINRGGWCPL